MNSLIAEKIRLAAFISMIAFLPFNSRSQSEKKQSNNCLEDSFVFKVFHDSLAFNTNDSSAANGVYVIWDTEKVDPYNIDILKKTDTTIIYFKDSSCKKYYHHPVINLKVNSNFGHRRYRYHYGIDLELETGDPVYSSFNGIVRYAKYVSGYGKCVVVTHFNGLETIYGHFSSILVGIGDTVEAGHLLGLGGRTGRATGSHLHYEIKFMGQQIDPNKVIDFSTGKLKNDSLLVHKYTFDYLIDLRKIKYHTIRSGDSLWKISRRYGVPISTLCRLNSISQNTILQIGRRIRYQ